MILIMVFIGNDIILMIFIGNDIDNDSLSIDIDL
jgi:hypothetical protein